MSTARLVEVRMEYMRTDAVVAVVLSLQPGEVATYSEVAEETGHPGSAHRRP